MAKESVIINIVQGRIENREPLKKLFTGLKDGRWLIEIHTAKKRTNPQNRYWWGIVVPVIQKGIEEMGTEMTKAETHEFLKAKFNFTELINTDTGEVVNLPKSTSRLSTVQFNEMIEKVQRFAAEFLGIDLPSPNEQMKISL